MNDPSPRQRWLLVGCATVYLGLALGNGLVWENSHDEGVTFQQAVSRIRLGHDASRPDRLSDTVRWSDGGTVNAPQDVVAELTNPYQLGMHPPAYYLFLNQWVRWTGTGTLALRWPAYLAGILSLIAMARIARRLVPQAEAAAAAPALLALSPWLVSFSSYARPYTIALCIALWSTERMLRLVSAPATWRRRLGFGALSLLGLYTIYHYAFVLAWQGAILGVSALRLGPGRRGRELAALAALGAAVVVGYLPWVPHLLAHLRIVQAPDVYDLYFHGSIPPAQWLSTAGATLRTFALAEVGGESRWLVVALAVLGALTLPLALFRLLPRRSGALPPPLRLVWFLMPLLPLLIIAADVLNDSKTITITKTSFFLLPLLILLVVGGIGAVPSRRLRIGGLAAWTLLFSAGSLLNLEHRAARQTDFERVAQEVAAHDDASHVVVLSNDLPGYAFPLLLTLRDAGVHRVHLLQVPGPELVASVDRLRRNAAVRRVTLLHFNVPYPDPFSADRDWTGRELREIRDRARASGWKVAQLGSASAAQRAGARRRTLVIAPGLRVKFFSM